MEDEPETPAELADRLRQCDTRLGSACQLAADLLAAQQAEIERLHAQFEVAEAARFAAVSKAQWQAVTNRELNERADETARLHAALALAEAALADIGDADRKPGDDLAWCEARAAQDLPAVRAALAGLGA